MQTIISSDSIQQRVRELADTINNDYPNEPLIVVCVLKGAVMFFSDLVRYLDMPVKYEFISVSSYGDNETPSQLPEVNLIDLNPFDIKNQNVLIVEDILGTGNTLEAVVRLISSFYPKDLRACILVDKTKNGFNFSNINVKNFRLYLGFRVISKAFLIGYGLDDKGFKRNESSIMTNNTAQLIMAEKLNGSYGSTNLQK